MQAITPNWIQGNEDVTSGTLWMHGATTRLRASQTALTSTRIKEQDLVAVDSSNSVAVPDRFGRKIFPHQPNRSQ